MAKNALQKIEEHEKLCRIMQKRLREIKRAYPNEIIDKNFFYPKRDFFKVIREYSKKSLKIKPQKESDESMIDKIKDAGSSFMDKFSETKPVVENNQTTQAPPLPNTPMPNRQMAALPSLQKNINTGLTRTESALLSPSEQVIARRT